MTPEQLEKAARHYCKLKHLDPDKIVAGAGPGLTSSRRPAWERVAEQLEDMRVMFESIKEATGDTMTTEQLQQAIEKEEKALTDFLERANTEAAFRRGRIAALKDMQQAGEDEAEDAA